MKILCLADLHVGETQLQNALSGELTGHLQQVRHSVSVENPDVIVVAGDLLPPGNAEYISAAWKQIFPAGIPVMTVLGNHDMWHSNFEDVLAKLRRQSVENPDVFFLDVIGACQIADVNFVGGMLGFDGSLAFRPWQKITPWNGFRDYKIPDIEVRYMEINAYYVDMIRANIKSSLTNVLLTHHVPHRLLMGQAPSEYSFYSGMRNLISELSFAPGKEHYLVCGHTHTQVTADIEDNIHGINVGSDYNILRTYVLTC